MLKMNHSIVLIKVTMGFLKKNLKKKNKYNGIFMHGLWVYVRLSFFDFMGTI